MRQAGSSEAVARPAVAAPFRGNSPRSRGRLPPRYHAEDEVTAVRVGVARAGRESEFLAQHPLQLRIEGGAPRRGAAQIGAQRGVHRVRLGEARAMDQQLADRHAQQPGIGRRAGAGQGRGERLRQRRVEGEPAAIDQAGDAHAGDCLGQAGERNGRARRQASHDDLADRLAAVDDGHPACPLAVPCSPSCARPARCRPRSGLLPVASRRGRRPHIASTRPNATQRVSCLPLV